MIDVLRGQWGATPLEDNVPSDSYYYQLAVYTGVRKGAGTRSKPSFFIHGNEPRERVKGLCKNAETRSKPIHFIHGNVSLEYAMGMCHRNVQGRRYVLQAQLLHSRE